MPALKLLTPFFLCLLSEVSETKRFTKCQLFHILKSEGVDGFSGYSLGDWICMAFHSSYYHTSRISRQHEDSGRSYGIFQLRNMEHCDDGCRTSLNRCRTDCMNFLNDDLRDDIQCVKKIIRTKPGMENWSVWTNNCKGKDLKIWTNCKANGPWEVWG